MVYVKVVTFLYIVLFMSLPEMATPSNSDDTHVKVVMKCPVSLNTCKGVTSQSGRTVATLSSGLSVLCDTQTDGGGWIVFQRRVNGNISFYRGWEDYRYGFGVSGTGDFYLGNENIHQLTSKRRYELRVDLRLNNATYFARYSRFRLYGETENYRVKISGFSGNATDSLMEYHNNKPFSTFDKDNDSSSRNCAKEFSGSWWYTDCHHSNLNGVWGSKRSGEGMIWNKLTSVSLTFSEMKIREI